jgi:endonuclease YncB( thermonuclease family)
MSNPYRAPALAAATLALTLHLGPCAAAPKAAAPALSGTITAVGDGMSLALTLPGQAALQLRLRDVEIPEPCQPGHAESRQALADFALNKPAIVQAGRRDVQGRAISTVKVDEADLSRRMVEEGYAWSVRSKWDQGPLVKQERMAQTLKRGLHASGKLSPTEFRKRFGACPASARS